MTNLREFKREIEDLFLKNNIDKNEVNIIFCEALNLTLPQLLLKENLSTKEQKKINRVVLLRLQKKPIQKIFKRAYFFGQTFFVNNNVLCPRPETELLVEECLKYIKNLDKEVDVLDLCTGSGAIAISIKSFSNANVFASDISPKALMVAKKNAKLLNQKVCFKKSNLFEKIHKKYDIIVSNPPYIKSEDIKNLDIEVKNFDPIISLDGGSDGLYFYKKIAQNAQNFLKECGVVFLEVGIDEAQNVKNIFEKFDFCCEIKKDYNNIERIVVARQKGIEYD